MTEELDFADPVSPGEVLAGKYRVERVIATGGMGVVVACTHLGLDQVVALKLLQPTALRGREMLRRFLVEARAAARIKGEHVAKVLDCGTLPSGIPFIVMEHLDGVDLQRLLADEGPLATPRAVDLVLEACEAVAEAHSKGIIHRDLKPANLMLALRDDGTQTIKVLDFGIAKVLSAGEDDDGLTTTADVLGTVRYMSPEQLRATRDVTGRADIWAFGVVLYELLTGETPFERGSRAETASAILNDPPRPLRDHLPDAGDELARVIDGCLEKQPARRTGSVAELAAALAPFGTSRARASLAQVMRFARAAEGDATWTGRADEDGGAGRPDASTTRRRRRRAWAIAAGAAALCAAAIALGTAAARSTPTVLPSATTAAPPEHAPDPAATTDRPARSAEPPPEAPSASQAVRPAARPPEARTARPAPRASASAPAAAPADCPDPKCARK